MAKIIQQDTFDGVVKENIDDLDMEPGEALQDAIQQFQSQGVILGTIVQDVRAYSQADDNETLIQHPVLVAVTALSKALDSQTIDDNQVITHLGAVQTECNIDLAHRCLAGKNDAFPVVFKACEHYKASVEMLKHIFRALKALCKGQPDVLEARAVDFFCDLLRQTTDLELCQLILSVIYLTCVMHENNRIQYVTAGLIPLLVSKLTDHRDNAKVVKGACQGLRVLTMDDDVRAVAGKAHEHARMIVDEANALKNILTVAQDYTEDHGILGELFGTLSTLAVRNEFCQQIVDLGGLKLVYKAIEENTDNPAILVKALGVLRTIAGNDDVKNAIVECGCVELILAVMDKHQAHPMVNKNGCDALANIALRHPKHCVKIMACGGAVGILQAMKVHKQVEGVQAHAFRAVRNLVGRNPEFCDTFLNLGAEGIIREAESTHKKLADEAKAALRDLGCEVKFAIPWLGQGNHLEQ